MEMIIYHRIRLNAEFESASECAPKPLMRVRILLPLLLKAHRLLIRGLFCGQTKPSMSETLRGSYYLINYNHITILPACLQEQGTFHHPL